MPRPTNNVYSSERNTTTDSSHCLVQCAAVTLEACVLWPGAIFFFLTMLLQHSQYDSRLGFNFRVLVRVSVRVRFGLG